MPKTCYFYLLLASLILVVVAASNESKLKLFLRPSECGVNRDKNAAIDEFPWNVLLMTDTGLMRGNCSGSLINSRWVLTAANCFFDHGDMRTPGVRARLGEWNLTSNPDYVLNVQGPPEEAPAFIDLPAKRVFIHEGYNKTRYQANDIALVKLLKPVPNFTKFVYPICLPFNEETREDRLEGADATVSGWRSLDLNRDWNIDLIRTTVKQRADLTVWNLQRCRNIYTKKGKIVDDTQMCALGDMVEDSGSALTMNAFDERHRSFTYIAGITSYGRWSSKANEVKPGVYTRVGAYMNWIRKKMIDKKMIDKSAN